MCSPRLRSRNECAPTTGAFAFGGASKAPWPSRNRNWFPVVLVGRGRPRLADSSTLESDIFLCARNLGRCSVSRVSMGPVSSAGRFQTQSEAPLARNTLNQRRFGRDDLCKQSNESRPADRCYG